MSADRVAELRPPQAVPPFLQREVQDQALPRADPHLRHDVGRLRGSADAVGPQVGLADIGGGAEDQLDRAAEVGVEVEVERLAVAVRPEVGKRVHILRGDAADRAEGVPEQGKHPVVVAGRPALLQEGLDRDVFAAQPGQDLRPALYPLPAGRRFQWVGRLGARRVRLGSARVAVQVVSQWCQAGERCFGHLGECLRGRLRRRGRGRACHLWGGNALGATSR